jgi:hypothetical protein
MPAYLVIREYKSVGDYHIFTATDGEDDDLSDIVGCEGVAATERSHQISRCWWGCNIRGCNTYA